MAGHARKISPVSLQAPQKESRSGGRTIAIDYLRTFVIVLVLIHHSILAYVNFGHFDPVHYLWSTAPIIDSHRWPWFDLIVLFNDIFFMSLMFFLSGLFVWPSLIRKARAHSCAIDFSGTALCGRGGLHHAARILSVVPDDRSESVSSSSGGRAASSMADWPRCLCGCCWPSTASSRWRKPASQSRQHPSQPRVSGVQFSDGMLRAGGSCVFARISADVALVRTGSLVRPGTVLGSGKPRSALCDLFRRRVMVGAYGLRDGAFGPDGTLAARWLFWVAAGLASFN